MKDNQRVNNLTIISQLALFGVSFAPLFLVLIIKMMYKESSFLHWGGFYKEAVIVCANHFWIVSFFIIYQLFSFVFTKVTLKSIDKQVKNGFEVKLKSVNNKSSETINYLATYIIPFVYDVNSKIDIVIMLMLLVFMFLIFRNSTLLLANPILTLKYGVYDFSYIEGDVEKSALVISNNKYWIENDLIKIYQIGHKMYYGIKID